MEPEDLHGKLYFSTTPIHKTNIIPLRWFANFCNLYPSRWALGKALRHEHAVEDTDLHLSKAGHRWWKLYAIFDKPYSRWGTTGRMDWHR